MNAPNGARIRRATGVGMRLVLIGVCVASTCAVLAPGYQSRALHSERASLPVSASQDRPLDVTSSPTTILVRGVPRQAVLHRPATPRAALVWVHGSGGGHADDQIHIARALAGAGIAVLVVDKVMDGYTWRHRDFTALAADAAGEATWLGTRLNLPAHQVGLFGVSEGGWVALIAAARHPELSGPIVLDSSPVVTPLEQSGYLLTRDLPGEPLRRLVTGLLATGRSLIYYLDTDVRGELPEVRNRVLAIFGSSDSTVPNAQAIGRLRDGLPHPPAVLLVPGGHVAPAGPWTDDVAKWVGGQELSGRTVEVTGSGAPRPPDPSPLLDPRIQTVAVFGIALAGALARRRRPATAEPCKHEEGQ